MTKYFVRNGRSWGTGPQRSGEQERRKRDIVFPIMSVASGRYSARQARQFMEKMSECSAGCDASGGKVSHITYEGKIFSTKNNICARQYLRLKTLYLEVCGSDGKTYSSECELRRAGCSRVRRQGRSFESEMLKIEVVSIIIVIVTIIIVRCLTPGRVGSPVLV